MLPERYQGVPCANVRANSSKMRRCAAQPSHLSSSLHPAPPRKPKASPPLIAEWHQPLSTAAHSLACLPLHTKPALAAVLRVVSSAFHAQRCHCTEPCSGPSRPEPVAMGGHSGSDEKHRGRHGPHWPLWVAWARLLHSVGRVLTHAALRKGAPRRPLRDPSP